MTFKSENLHACQSVVKDNNKTIKYCQENFYFLFRLFGGFPYTALGAQIPSPPYFYAHFRLG